MFCNHTGVYRAIQHVHLFHGIKWHQERQQMLPGLSIQNVQVNTLKGLDLIRGCALHRSAVGQRDTCFRRISFLKRFSLFMICGIASACSLAHHAVQGGGGFS